MAIVKILKSSKTFRAVDYNEKRVERGEAKLLVAQNFNVLFEDKDNYKAYLEAWSQKNSRIKNPQMHVVLSLKGSVDNADSLVSIGKQWLEKMGYGDNPALIYLHNNTSNTHIHIITSRVDKNGKKINHNFERKRSQKVLNQIQGVDELKEFRKFIASLLRYSFSTKKQFIELCKVFNIQCDEKDNGYILMKNGKSLFVNGELIDFCSKRYFKTIDDKEKKKLQAKIYKYAAIMDKDSFVDYMRKTFGVKFVFYGKGEIYAFNIIDFNRNAVYKGSEIFSMKKLKELFSIGVRTGNIPYYNIIIGDHLKIDSTADVDSLNDKLIKLGIYTDGLRIYSLKSNEELGEVKSKYSSRILYNTRVNKVIRDFNPQTEEEKKQLSKLHGIKLKDLDRNVDGLNNATDFSYYKNLISEILDNGDNLKDSLELYGIEIFYENEDYILYDHSNNVIASLDRVGVDKSIIEDKYKEYKESFRLGQKYQDEYIGEDYDYQPEVLLLDIVAGLMSVSSGGVSSLGKKRKRK